MKKSELQELWKQDREHSKQHNLGSSCYNSDCKGKFQELTKPFSSDGNTAYLECDACDSHLMYSPFEQWLSDRRKHAKQTVVDAKWHLDFLKRDLVTLKEKIASAEADLLTANANKKKWSVK